jgi:hypothetical protein
MKIAPYQNGDTRSMTAMPNMASQIAGLKSRQSPVMTQRILEHANGVHPLGSAHEA